MRAAYNEIDRFCCDWLSNLMDAGLIMAGPIYDCDIHDLDPGHLVGFPRVHLFAGVAGWDYALRLAGWPIERPVWTCSCPCQPFSVVGKRQGAGDPRHLWPEAFRLICKRRPPVVFGEQVASAKVWLDGVCADLEAVGYAFGAAVLPACAVDAKHIRKRIWFVADAIGGELWEQPGRGCWARGESASFAAIDGAQRSMADASGVSQRESAKKDNTFANEGRAWFELVRDGQSLADADRESPVGASIPRRELDAWDSEPAVGRVVDGVSPGMVEPLLRAYGNSIVPQLAAEFIGAYLDLM